MPYYTYILQCADQSLYTGYTNDTKKRIIEHNESKKGAKYTSGRRPVTLAYKEEFETKSEAMKREIEIKKMTKKEKLHLIGYKNAQSFYGIPYSITSSKKRKNFIGLRITALGVEVRTPQKYDTKKIVNHLEQKKKWIEKNRQKIQKNIQKPTLESGLVSNPLFILYFGVKYSIDIRDYDQKSTCVFDGENLRLYLKQQKTDLIKRNNEIQSLILSWYKKEATHYLQERTTELAKLHSFTQLKNIFIKSYKAKYGMCKGKDIYLDYKLIIQPKGIIDHIILHELTHLIHKHHQPSFWDKLKNLDPKYKEHKDYLNGKTTEL